MHTRITQDQVMSHMTSFAGQSFTCKELAEWFGISENSMSSLLKQLVMQSRIVSDYVLNSRLKESSYTYPDKAKQIAVVAASTRPPLKDSLAKKFMRERLAEAIPPNRPHHCCTSRLPPNNLDKD